MLDRHLRDHGYLAGEYPIADIANRSWVRTHNWSGVAVDHLPHLKRWIGAIAARPAAAKGITVPFEIKTMDHGEGEEAQQLAVEIRRMVQR